jgi:antitoxin component YwqK of YwqJK toxin-antitoxin module
VHALRSYAYGVLHGPTYAYYKDSAQAESKTVYEYGRLIQWWTYYPSGGLQWHIVAGTDESKPTLEELYSETGGLILESHYDAAGVLESRRTYYDIGDTTTGPIYTSLERDGSGDEYLYQEYFEASGDISYKGTKRAIFDEYGNLTGFMNIGTHYTYFENYKGVVASETPYVDGLISGVAIKYQGPDLPLREETYVDGFLDGLSTLYYPSGVIRETIEYKDGLKEGEDRLYYEDRSLGTLTTYHRGLREGPIMEYAASVSGNHIVLDGQYHEDAPVGTWTFWAWNYDTETWDMSTVTY